MSRLAQYRRSLVAAAALTTVLAGGFAGPAQAASKELHTAATGAVSPAPVASATAGCTVKAKLVPTCNILWGAAAGGFSSTPRDQALRHWEQASGRPATIYHTYHRGDELFPTAAETAMARDSVNPRLLLINWKVAYGTTWAKVAAGQQNARIDRLADHLKTAYRDPFFLVLHHEPENDVVATTGSGMTAGDYAAMFRYTVQRLRSQGVSNAVFVVAYMGLEKFYNQPWWHDLYPGDDVVDWIGLDAYVTARPGGYHYGFLPDLLNRTTNRALFPGFYTWSQTRHPAKPLMLSEWGVHEYPADPAQKAKILSKVLADLDRFPAVKAMVWFDTAKDQNGADIRINSSAAALAQFRTIAASPRFVVRLSPGGAPDRTAPTLSVSSPWARAKVRGVVTVKATAADAAGIARVQLFAAGRLVATDTTAPYALAWNSGRANGRVPLTVRASDRAGNTASVHRAVVADNRAPVLTVKAAPKSRTKVRGTVTVRLAATDASGISRVEAVVNGRVVARDNRAGYHLRIVTGRHARRMTVTLRAYDRAGNVRSIPARTWYR